MYAWTSYLKGGNTLYFPIMRLSYKMNTIPTILIEQFRKIKKKQHMSVILNIISTVISDEISWKLQQLSKWCCSVSIEAAMFQARY